MLHRRILTSTSHHLYLASHPTLQYSVQICIQGSIMKMMPRGSRDTGIKDNWKCILICLAMSLANCQYGYVTLP